MPKRLLLVSNSTNPGEGYLDHCMPAMRETLGAARDLLFVPFALHDLDAYAARAAERFAREDVAVHSLHHADDPVASIDQAAAIFIGGGNTFRLLARLYELGVMEPLRRRVAAGAPYLGTSAGSNVACPTIRTTNDMPIVEPASFQALGLVPFNLNAHYVDRDPDVAHGGETREQRIAEFHEENLVPVVGLREGAMLRIDDGRVTLLGTADARVFRHGQTPVERSPGETLDDLLDG
jgi:dipeptidase E